MVLLRDADYRQYLEFLRAYAGNYRVAVHGYCLMPNHARLVLTPPDEQALARAIGRAQGGNFGDT